MLAYADNAVPASRKKLLRAALRRRGEKALDKLELRPRVKRTSPFLNFLASQRLRHPSDAKRLKVTEFAKQAAQKWALLNDSHKARYKFAVSRTAKKEYKKSRNQHGQNLVDDFLAADLLANRPKRDQQLHRRKVLDKLIREKLLPKIEEE
jgi:hypothetical protein